MKTLTLSLLVLLFPFLLMSQSVSPEVISSSGDYFEGSNASISWTLGEIATETYSNGSVILTQGFQQPYSVAIHGIVVFLEGPYGSGTMATDLKDHGALPLSQPYNTAPWNYGGTESVGAIPANVVDWVLVDLRDATSASNATGATTVERQAAFLLSNGSVVGLDGTSLLVFSAPISNTPYLAVWHRNHLGVLSANPLSGFGGQYSYDFSTSVDQAHGGSAGYKLIDTGLYGMVAGDADSDGTVDGGDISAWGTVAGTSGYTEGDLNMDAQANNPDKNDVLIPNTGKSDQVPD